MKMPKVILTLQNKEPEEIQVEEFDLKTDFYDYVLGNVKDPNGNLIQGVLIGNKRYVRLIDVVDIDVVEEVEQEEEV